jgi:hypothetical protein
MQHQPSKKARSSDEFPKEIVQFIPYKNNPLFAGTGTTTWDNQIRERGFILREDSNYYSWYTGYKTLKTPSTWVIQLRRIGLYGHVTKTNNPGNLAATYYSNSK